MFYSLYSAFEAPHGCYQMDLNHVFNLAFGFRGSTPLCHQMSLYLLDCTYLSPL
jgi:hypothetical protein